MALCKKSPKPIRNPVKHIALFAQNSVAGDAEHIAGHSDLLRNLGIDSSASTTRALPHCAAAHTLLCLLSRGVPGSGGNSSSLAANLSTHFCVSVAQDLQQQVLNLQQFLTLMSHWEVPGKVELICYSTKGVLKNTFSRLLSCG